MSGTQCLSLLFYFCVSWVFLSVSFVCIGSSFPAIPPGSPSAPPPPWFLTLWKVKGEERGQKWPKFIVGFEGSKCQIGVRGGGGGSIFGQTEFGQHRTWTILDGWVVGRVEGWGPQGVGARKGGWKRPKCQKGKNVGRFLDQGKLETRGKVGFGPKKSKDNWWILRIN